MTKDKCGSLEIPIYSAQTDLKTELVSKIYIFPLTLYKNTFLKNKRLHSFFCQVEGRWGEKVWGLKGWCPLNMLAMMLTMVKLNMVKSACYAHSADHLDQSLFTAAWSSLITTLSLWSHYCLINLLRQQRRHSCSYYSPWSKFENWFSDF